MARYFPRAPARWQILIGGKKRILPTTNPSAPLSVLLPLK
ncbi:hypothetical protein RNAN_0466 [Rheinheimera nanhaiensis E407-8]|uniref:Uncharacterized protein n=1 Tax=Rheinheimera nanhaiensis E407-8 TaxID=562729 RepID=I1DTX0_9GAMM|nr:hypothetical protein RNAN_0466 [Rheinheimera nanhaiensis E407-8]